MKPFPLLLSVGAFLAATLQAPAAFESVKIEATTEPLLTPSVKQSLLSDAQVVVVVNVSAEGQVTDHLVVGHTNEKLVQPVVAVLKEWKYTPARLDGVAVPAQVPLTVSFDQSGMVVSCLAMEMTEYFFNTISGVRMQYRLHGPRELDRAPIGVNLATPKYAKAAAKQGIHGTVTVRFYIDETGTTRMPSVESSSNPYLAEIAAEAVRGWKFEPSTVRGRPVLIEASQDFVFRAEP